MDRQRIRRAGMGKRASAAPNPGREKLRMIVYGIVAVAIFSLLVAKDGDPPPTDELPDDRYQTPREYEPLARVDPARLTSVRDDTDTARAVLEPGPLQHLIDQASKLVYGDMARLGVQAVPRAELLADSAARRGDPVCSAACSGTSSTATPTRSASAARCWTSAARAGCSRW